MGGGGGGWKGDSPLRVIHTAIENEIWSICEFFRKSFFSKKGWNVK